MKNTKEKGTYGEQIALDHLRKRQYEVLDCNWRHSRWEIDIIARRSSKLIFIEVKTRNMDSYAEEVTLVSKKQQENLFRAASKYMENQNYTGDIRFDVIKILLNTDRTYQLEHFEDAFY